MRNRTLFLVLAACLAAFGQSHQEPLPPGLIEARKSLEQHTVDPPIPAPRPKFDAAQWRRKAEELARLASNLPTDADKVSKGQLPKELPDRLKRIEKLAKELRLDVSR